MEQGADLAVSSLLQTIIIRCLPMLEGIAADVVERITVGQLGLPEQVVLLRRRDEFQFGGDDLLHTLVHPEQAPSRLPVLANRFTAGLGLHLRTLRSKECACGVRAHPASCRKRALVISSPCANGCGKAVSNRSCGE